MDIKPGKIKLLVWSLKQVWESAPGWAFLNILFSLFRCITPLIFIFLTKELVDSLAGYASAPEVDQAQLLRQIILIAFVWLADEVSAEAGSFARRKQSVLLETRMYRLLHEKAIKTDLSSFEDPEYFDLLSRAGREATWRPGSVLNNIVTFFRGFISLIIMAGLLLSLNWWLAILLLAVNIPGIFIRIKYSGLLYSSNRDHTPDSRKSAYYNWLLTGDRPAREMKLFALGNYFRGLFEKSFLIQKDEELKILKKQALAETSIVVLKAVALGCALWLVTLNIANGKAGAGEGAMILLAFRQGLVYLKEIFSSGSGLFEDSVFISDAYDFLSVNKERKEESFPHEKPVSGNSIAFRNVSFSYPGAGTPVLKDISFTIKTGEKLAVVGHNGAGKSTLVKLITRLYEPDNGTIELDGKDVRLYDSNEYRKLFSVVFQDFMLYNLGAGENIALGDVTIKSDHEKIRKAASDAGIDDLIESLPSSYNTEIGNLFGDSRELSWGEWQKIAIARALYRNSPFLILDEPSSALDATSENEVFTRLQEILKERTAIMISHRLANISLADRIIVLNKGRISETGTHNELIAKKGEYYEIFKKQTGRYEH